MRDGKETATGFVRTLDLSRVGVMIESPDRFESGQELTLEFLMDNDELLKIRGIVSHVTTDAQGMNRVGVIFQNVSARVQELLTRQIQ